MMVYSGVRPESLGDYCGKDMIRLAGFKEAKMIEFNSKKVPRIVTIRNNLSKG